MDLLMLFIICNAIITAFEQNNDFVTENQTLTKQFLPPENFYNINNTTISYHRDNFINRISSLTCFNYQNSGLKKCTATSFDLSTKR